MPRPSLVSSSARAALTALGLALAVGSANAEGAASGSEAVMVSVDNAKVIRLPPSTATVIVGNPGIADVTIQKNGVLILTGKSYGATNLIALDAAGGMLAESSITVRAPESGTMVTVQRGLDRQSYSCLPACQPTVQIGDETKYFTELSSQATNRNTLATSSGPGAR